MRKTFVEIPELNLVDYNRPVSFLGSCFSENVSKKAKACSLEVQSNPLGVIFNPISLGSFLLGLQDDSWNNKIVNRGDLYFSWEANSSVFGYSERELQTKIDDLRSSFEKTLSKSSTLFITFGTSWVYELKSSNEIVANCHKFDQKLFLKRLLSIREIVDKWNKVIQNLNDLYPELTIVFTLSPVRHVKDGLIENARSKAILLESMHQLVDEFKNCHYFPAYEILIDELRDYGFYAKDGIHPNEIAVDEVWESFYKGILTPKAKIIASEWLEVKKLLDHKIQYGNSNEAQKFIKHREDQLLLFKSKYPNINLEY